MEINYAAFLARRGELKESAAAFAATAKRLETFAREDPGRIETRISLATAFLNWGQVTSTLGDSPRTRDMFRQAASYFKGAAQLVDESPHYVRLMAQANVDLAIAEGMLGNYSAEIEAYRQTIAAYDVLVSQLPNVASFLEERARTQIDLVQTMLLRDPDDSLLPTAEDAEKTFAKLKSMDPSAPRYSEEHGVALDLLARVHEIAGERAAALEQARAASAELSELAGHWPDVPNYQDRAATSESLVAEVLAADGRYDEASKEFAAATRRLEPVLALHPEIPGLWRTAAVAQSRWGETLAMAGDESAAGTHADLANEHWQRLLQLSSDAKYLAEAAWHFATFPIEAKRDPLRAAEYAQGAIKQSASESALCDLIGAGQTRTRRSRGSDVAVSLAEPGR